MSLQELIIQNRINAIVKSIDDLNETANNLGINTHCITKTVFSKMKSMYNNLNTIDKYEIIKYLLSKFKKEETNLDKKNIFVGGVFTIKIDGHTARGVLEYSSYTYINLYHDFFRFLKSECRANEYTINSFNLEIYQDDCDSIVFDFSNIINK